MGDLVGREQEVRWLRERIAAPEAGSGRVLLVTGEAGIGKTHLLRAAIPPDPVLTSVAFPQAHFATPGFGLRTLAEAAHPAAERLRAELASTEVDPQGWRLLAIHDAAGHLLRSSPGGIIVLDDLQWADELTLGWLSQVGGVLREIPATIVCGVRTPDELPQRVMDALTPAMRQGLVEPLQLQPLSLDAVAELVRARGFDDVDEHATTLLELTGGIPLAVREVLSELQRRDMGIETLVENGTPTLPTLPLVAGIVREQIADLDRDALQVLAICCLAPPPVPERTIRSVAGIAAPAFDAALGAAIGSGILQQAKDGTIAFRHELQREAFQGQLTLADRRALHRRIAGVLSADPSYPAGPIADQLAEAGLIDEALEWLERAAKESGEAHDHGNALTYLEAAMTTCPSADNETLARLAERAVTAARSCDQITRGLSIVASALGRVTSPQHRGRLLLCRGKLASFGGDYSERASSLEQARLAFITAGDAPRVARVLGELAFPAGDALSLQDRIRLGSEGLALAERLRDPDALVQCAIHLASTKFFASDPDAFSLWARAAAVLEENLSTELGESPSTGLGQTDSERSELLLRNHSNWSLAALAYGDYAEARRVMHAGQDLCKVPFWQGTFQSTNALYLWRTGSWDAALDTTRHVQQGVARPQSKVVARAIEAAIVFERERRPDVEPLIDAVRSLIEWSDEEFGSIALSILIRIRSARREPRPDRNLMQVVDLITASGVRIGWEDLLPAAAEIDPALYRRISNALGADGLSAPRALAARCLAEGTVAAAERSREAEPLLLEAAERFRSLPEPYLAARALETLGHRRRAEGGRCGEPFAEAAQIYQALGADRSLATLLRRSGNHTVLHPFKVPASQAHAGAPGLTPREQDVADLARRGYTARAIGAELGIAPVTAKKHLERIKSKLGAERKSDLVRILADGH